VSLCSIASLKVNKSSLPKSSIMSVLMTIIATFILATFPGWHKGKHAKPFPTGPLLHGALFFYSAAALFAMIAALWQHTAGAAVASVADIVYLGAVRAEVGTVALVLAWLAFSLAAFVAMILLVRVLAFRSMSRK